MCGIFGANEITENVGKILPLLAWEMEARGKDSWGASNGEETIKHVGMITESWELPEDWEEGIFHTRAATHGSAKSEENAHPFTFDTPAGGKIIGIHNGVIRNHTALNTKYGRDFAVDSMHIFKNLAEGLGFKELEGYGAMAWWEVSPSGKKTLNFSRSNHHDLHVCSLEDGEIVFCSQIGCLQKAATMMGNPVKCRWTLEEGKHYRVEEGKIVEVGPLPFKKTVDIVNHDTYPWSNNVYTGRGYQGGGGYYPVGGKSKDKCYVCQRVKINVKTEVFCPSCLEEKVKGFKYERNKEGATSGVQGNTVQSNQTGSSTDSQTVERFTRFTEYTD